MAYASPDQIREKLVSEEAKESFNTINKLNPRWVVIEEDEKVYLAPTIETKKIGGGMLNSIGSGWAKTFDEAAKNQLSNLKEKASADGTIIVVDAYQTSRAEYRYDPGADNFVPYKP